MTTSKGGRPRIVPWESVDWGDDNVSIARRLGVPVNRVEHRRAVTGAGPARKSARAKREEAGWARFLQVVREQAPLVFVASDLVPHLRRYEGEPRKRCRDRVRDRLDVLARHGLVRNLGRSPSSRGTPSQFVLTMRAHLLIKAHERLDAGEWEALTNERSVSDPKGRRRKRRW